METDEIHFYHSNFIEKQKNAIDTLAKKKGKEFQTDPLIQAATKRSSDTLKITNYLIKNRLTQQLQNTIDTFVTEHPELTDQFFIAFISDENFQAEVVSKQQAIESVNDASKEEAEAFFTQNQMGYFKREQFTLQTGSDSSFQEFKGVLNRFMDQNGTVIQYLRDNKENLFNPENLF